MTLKRRTALLTVSQISEADRLTVTVRASAVGMIEYPRVGALRLREQRTLSPGQLIFP